VGGGGKKAGYPLRPHWATGTADHVSASGTGTPVVGVIAAG
jgi:hypothetical protein